MHSGKTTLSKVLQGRGYVRQAFADPVKDFSTTAVNNIHYDKAQILGSDAWTNYTTDDLNADKETFRELFQWIGAYGRLAFGPDIWIRIFDKLNIPPKSPKVVVDDLRYLNEAEFLRSHGYHIIRIERPEHLRRESIRKAYESLHDKPMPKKLLKKIGRHESETEVPMITVDRVVQNNGTIQDLENIARIISGDLT
jgi:hypothetical protein